MLGHQILLEEKLKNKNAGWFLQQQGYSDVLDYASKRSSLARGAGWNDSHTVLLGQQMAMFENSIGFINENSGGTSSDLLDLPVVGLDVIGGLYGESIAPYVGSVQTLKERQGIIWFKNVVANRTRGNVIAGQKIRDGRRAQQVYPRGHAFARQGKVVVDQVQAGNTTHYISLTGAPVKPKSVNVTIPALGILDSSDNGRGKIYATNVEVTMNYQTGSATLVFVTAPTTSGADIIFEWESDLEQGKLGSLSLPHESMQVTAEILALEGETSIHKDFDFQNRFGQEATQIMAETLVNELTAERNLRISEEIRTASLDSTLGLTNIEWDPNPKDGVAFWEHYPGFANNFKRLSQGIYTTAGRGRCTTVLAGTEICTLADMNPRFVPSNIDADGPAVFGTLDNITFIRCPNYDPLEAVGLYKGRGRFDAPFVLGSYMPLYVNGSIPGFENPLMKKGVVTTWESYSVPIPYYLARFELTDFLTLI